jgi:hypothetical protein
VIYLTISSLSDAEFTTGHQRPFQTDCSIIQTRGTHLNPMIMRKIILNVSFCSDDPKYYFMEQNSKRHITWVAG